MEKAEKVIESNRIEKKKCFSEAWWQKEGEMILGEQAGGLKFRHRRANAKGEVNGDECALPSSSSRGFLGLCVNKTRT